MALVIDASVAFKWFVPELATEQALALLDTGTPLTAPDLVTVEVANAMWARLRGREGFPQIVTDAALAIPRMFDTLVQTSGLVARGLDMAIGLNHPLYDCIYLALAERDGSRLITADSNFAQKVKSSQFAELVSDLAGVGG